MHQAAQAHNQNKRQEYAQHQAGAKRMGYRAAHAVIIPCPEPLRRNGCQPAGKTECDNQKRKIYRSRRADGCQRVFAQKATDDENVGKLVELLEDVAYQDGQRKKQNKFEGIALGHILYHQFSFVIFGAFSWLFLSVPAIIFGTSSGNVTI